MSKSILGLLKADWAMPKSMLGMLKAGWAMSKSILGQLEADLGHVKVKFRPVDG